jgi:hypothetical protein
MRNVKRTIKSYRGGCSQSPTVPYCRRDISTPHDGSFRTNSRFGLALREIQGRPLLKGTLLVVKKVVLLITGLIVRYLVRFGKVCLWRGMVTMDALRAARDVIRWDLWDTHACAAHGINNYDTLHNLFVNENDKCGRQWDLDYTPFTTKVSRYL